MYLVQLSDLHLFADKEATLLKLNTWQSYTAVVSEIAAHHQQPDSVILSGDLSQDYSSAAYRHVVTGCEKLTCPIYWMPGNHDDPLLMEQIFAPTFLKPDKLLHWQNWTIILLDSHCSQHVYGRLTAAQLAWLQTTLQDYAHQHILIFLHHHPLAVGSAWLDQSMLQNASEFLSVVDQFSHIRGIICGHIHQVRETHYRRIPVLSAPATSLQFLPHSQNFALDRVNPGYRWFKLQPEGIFQTGIERVKNFVNTVDFTATGY